MSRRPRRSPSRAIPAEASDGPSAAVAVRRRAARRRSSPRARRVAPAAAPLPWRPRRAVAGGGRVGARRARAAGRRDQRSRAGELTGEELTSRSPRRPRFYKRKAEDPANRTIVPDALRELTGRRWRVSLRAARGARTRRDGAPAEHATPRRSGGALHGGVRRRGAAPTSSSQAAERRRLSRCHSSRGNPTCSRCSSRCRRCSSDMELAQEELDERDGRRPPPAAAWSP